MDWKKLVFVAQIILSIAVIIEASLPTNPTTHPGKLVKNREVKQIIKLQRNTVTIESYPLTTNLYTHRRRVYWKYCYNGGNLDPNTGCSSNTEEVPASRIEEVDRWVTSGKCRTGKECPPRGWCWGSDANNMCRNHETNVDSDPGPLKWVSEEYMVFAHHSCIKSWECYFHKETVDNYVLISANNVKLGFNLPQGKFVEVKLDGKQNSYKDSDGYTHYYKLEERQLIKRNAEAICMGAENTGVICTILNDELLEGISINFAPGTYQMGHKNNLITVHGDILFIGSDGMKIVRENRNTWQFYHVQDAYGLQKSSSMQSLIEALNSIHMIQMQGIYNSIQLENYISEIESKFINLIKHLMTRDREILGKVMEKNILTVNLNEDEFVAFLNEPKLGHIEGNCKGPFIYKEGFWVKRRPEEYCEYPHSNGFNNYTLFGGANLSISLTREGTISVSARDSSMWEWLAGERWADRSHVGGYGEKDLVSDPSSSVFGMFRDPFQVVRDWISFVSSFIGWIALVLHFVKR
uniref:Hemagglutinin protein n=1 Tax=Blattella germanica orthomyxovirus 1 TaxID=3133491 RepID=A0AAT9JNA5_9ORTO